MCRAAPAPTTERVAGAGSAAACRSNEWLRGRRCLCVGTEVPELTLPNPHRLSGISPDTSEPQRAEPAVTGRSRWPRNPGRDAKYQTREHRQERARLVALMAAQGFLMCAQPECLLATRVIHFGERWHLGHDDREPCSSARPTYVVTRSTARSAETDAPAGSPTRTGLGGGSYEPGLFRRRRAIVCDSFTRTACGKKRSEARRRGAAQPASLSLRRHPATWCGLAHRRPPRALVRMSGAPRRPRDVGEARAERARTSDKGASPDKSPRVVRTARRSGRGVRLVFGVEESVAPAARCRGSACLRFPRRPLVSGTGRAARTRTRAPTVGRLGDIMAAPRDARLSTSWCAASPPTCCAMRRPGSLRRAPWRGPSLTGVRCEPTFPVRPGAYDCPDLPRVPAISADPVVVAVAGRLHRLAVDLVDPRPADTRARSSARHGSSRVRR